LSAVQILDSNGPVQAVVCLTVLVLIHYIKGQKALSSSEDEA
jgi:hypothetical protein